MQHYNSIVAGSLGTYLAEVYSSGPQKMWFPDGKKKIYFETHKKLDKFVNDFFEMYPSKKDINNPDYLLLKSFDRVFWHKYYDPTLSPEELEPFQAAPNCNFHDPKSEGHTEDRNFF